MRAPSGAEPLRLRLPDVLASVEQARQAVLAHLAPHQLSTRTLYQVELVIEELMMNQIRHAHASAGGHWLDLAVTVDPARLVLCFEDDGRPFDPTHQAPAAPPPATLDEAPVGGLGLGLVRRAASQLVYERRAGRNLLTVELPRG